MESLEMKASALITGVIRPAAQPPSRPAQASRRPASPTLPSHDSTHVGRSVGQEAAALRGLGQATNVSSSHLPLGMMTTGSSLICTLMLS